MKVESRPHAPDLGLGVKLLDMATVLRPLPLRNQYLDLLTDQLIARIGKQSFRLGVRLDDDALPVDDNDSIRNGFQNAGRQKGFSLLLGDDDSWFGRGTAG
jgi:hypothetical protein